MTEGMLNINFSKPTRQSYVAIIMILYRVYQRFIKQFWYVLIPMFVGKKENVNYFLFGLIVIAVLLAIYSIISFFRYRFHVKDDEFVVERGVFSKKKIIIPFDRIQSVNFKQNLVHQVFNVVGLEIDTAGTSKKEFDFDALSMSKSEALRDYIFQSKASDDLIKEGAEVENKEQKSPKLLMQLSFGNLVKIGVTQNHFKSFALVLLFAFGAMGQLEDIGIELDKYGEVAEENLLKLGAIFMGILAVFVLIFFVIVSVVITVFKFFDLRFLRIKNGFKLEHGLFNRNEISVMDNKMQALKWSDNLLRKILKLFTIQINLASSATVQKKTAIVIPGAKKSDINNIKSYYFSENYANISEFYESDKYYLRRRITIILSIFLMLCGILVGLDYYQDLEFFGKSIFILTLIFAYFIATSFLKYGKLKYGINEEIIQINSGIFGNRYAVYPIYKLQGVSIRQSPAQLRKGLANLDIYSSSGVDTIRYIHREKAQQLRDFILFQIENTQKQWM